jgi:hypothetical protein
LQSAHTCDPNKITIAARQPTITFIERLQKIELAPRDHIQVAMKKVYPLNREKSTEF